MPGVPALAYRLLVSTMRVPFSATHTRPVSDRAPDLQSHCLSSFCMPSTETMIPPCFSTGQSQGWSPLASLLARNKAPYALQTETRFPCARCSPVWLHTLRQLLMGPSTIRWQRKRHRPTSSTLSRPDVNQSGSPSDVILVAKSKRGARSHQFTGMQLSGLLLC